MARVDYDRDGIVHVRDDHFIGSAHGDGYHTTFHAPWYVLEHWAGWFDVVAYLPQGVDVQDLVVLRRRRTAATGPTATPHRRRDGAGSRSGSEDEPVPTAANGPPPSSWPNSAAPRGIVDPWRPPAQGNDRAALDTRSPTALDDVAPPSPPATESSRCSASGCTSRAGGSRSSPAQLREDLDAVRLLRDEHAD